ncbi:MAG: LysE family translocator [Trueperaceae bacterium]|nr:LysE family translocator [Trueperaceae bacterium]
MPTLLPIISFAFVMSITPGPNNIMLWASGANFGFKRSLPHMLGINLGFGSLLLLCGLGLGALFEQFPLFQLLLKIGGSLYLVYLAYRIATASGIKQGEAAKPINFWEAASFQYINPKAWVMGLTAMSAFVLPQGSFILSTLVITLIFMLVNLPCISVWVIFGSAMGRFLTNPKLRLAFNLTLSALLIGIIFMLF